MDFLKAVPTQDMYNELVKTNDLQGKSHIQLATIEKYNIGFMIILNHTSQMFRSVFSKDSCKTKSMS